jgi:hypothetical protein
MQFDYGTFDHGTFKNLKLSDLDSEQKYFNADNINDADNNDADNDADNTNDANDANDTDNLKDRLKKKVEEFKIILRSDCQLQKYEKEISKIIELIEVLKSNIATNDIKMFNENIGILNEKIIFIKKNESGCFGCFDCFRFKILNKNKIYVKHTHQKKSKKKSKKKSEKKSKKKSEKKSEKKSKKKSEKKSKNLKKAKTNF